MLVEISGAQFDNKGAHLMLAAVCLRLREVIPDVRVSMPLDQAAYAEERAAYRALLTFRRPDWSDSWRYIARDALCYALGKGPLGRMFGLVPADRVDALIDISGYAFGDKWPKRNMERFARRAAALRDRGKPVVLLPQMLGPFTKPGYADAFRLLGRSVDRIYAREAESFEYAEPLVDSAVLRTAPDITIPVPAKPAPEADGDYACVVPNSRMLEHNPQQNWGEVYLPRLLAACRHLAARGLRVKIVQHEYDAGDTTLVRTLRHELGSGVEVVRHSDPQVLKGILGGARTVIGSRFHSLVSALSMGVPVIALGWAHKYEALLRDFSVSDYVHFAHQPWEHLQDLIDETLSRRDEIHATLQGRKAKLAADVEAMWDDIYALLGVRRTTHAETDDAPRMEVPA